MNINVLTAIEVDNKLYEILKIYTAFKIIKLYKIKNRNKYLHY